MLSGNGWLAAVEKAKLRGARAPAERPEDLFAYPLNIARRPMTKKQPEAFLWVSSGVVRRWWMSVCWYGRGKLVLDAA